MKIQTETTVMEERSHLLHQCELIVKSLMLDQSKLSTKYEDDQVKRALVTLKRTSTKNSSNFKEGRAQRIEYLQSKVKQVKKLN